MRYAEGGIVRRPPQSVAAQPVTASVEATNPPTMAVLVDGTAIVLPSAPHTGLPRIDTIVESRDYVANEINIRVLVGTFARNPCPPVLTQNTSLWETRIADVLIPGFAQSINNSLIFPRGVSGLEPVPCPHDHARELSPFGGPKHLRCNECGETFTTEQWWARVQRKRYDALIAEGFTEDQAAVVLGKITEAEGGRS